MLMFKQKLQGTQNVQKGDGNSMKGEVQEDNESLNKQKLFQEQIENNRRNRRQLLERLEKLEKVAQRLEQSYETAASDEGNIRTAKMISRGHPNCGQDIIQTRNKIRQESDLAAINLYALQDETQQKQIFEQDTEECSSILSGIQLPGESINIELPSETGRSTPKLQSFESSIINIAIDP